MINRIKAQKKETVSFIRRIFNRDFSGNSGLAFKNSFYQTIATITAHISSFVLLIILARTLMPELFGLYSLALSTILLFVSFSNLGISETLIRYVSKELGRGNLPKARAYTLYFTKIKFIITAIICFALLISAGFISNIYYGKPLFLSLFIAGPLFILFAGFINFIQLIFQSANDFKGILYKEIVSQLVKLLFVILSVIFILNYFVSTEKKIFILMMALVLTWVFTLGFFLLLMKKKITYLNAKKINLSLKEKKSSGNFLKKVFIYGVSGLFFSYINILFLGKFVVSSYIGYYNVALSLVGIVSPLLIFGTILLPIFSRLKGKRLEEGFRKSAKITLFISSLALLFIFIFSYFIINLAYGSEYLISVPFLRILSLLVISTPLIYLYNTYFISRGKIKVIVGLLTAAAIFNILLNVILVIGFINYGPLFITYGICISAIISNYFYLFGLMFYKNKINKKPNKKINAQARF